MAPVVGEKGLWFEDAARYAPHLVDELVKEFNCDPQRVVVAGCSNGGTTALTWLARHPDYFAAALAYPGWLHGSAKNVSAKPIFIRYGAGDSQGWKKSVRQSSADLSQAGADVQIRQVPFMGHMVSIGQRELLAWLADEVGTPESK